MARVCLLTILVDDLAKALDFYAIKLGFSVVSRADSPDYALLETDTMQVALHRVDKVTWPEYDHQAAVVPGIAVDDIEATIARLKSQNADLIHETPQRFFAGYYAALRDPAGNPVELIQLDETANEMPLV